MSYLAGTKGVAMSRRGAIDLMAALILIMLSWAPASASSPSYTDLMNLTMSTEDARISVEDLAFLLATHNFDAVPNGDYVAVKVNGAVYKMVPNGQKPGLAEMTIMS